MMAAVFAEVRKSSAGSAPTPIPPGGGRIVTPSAEPSGMDSPTAPGGKNLDVPTAVPINASDAALYARMQAFCGPRKA